MVRTKSKESGLYSDCGDQGPPALGINDGLQIQFSDATISSTQVFRDMKKEVVRSWGVKEGYGSRQ